MLAIEIRVNGELKAICGTDDLHHLVGAINVTQACHPTGGESVATCRVECMGVRALDSSTDEVLKWVSARIQLGDDIAFRVVETAKAHAPIDRQKITASSRASDA